MTIASVSSRCAGVDAATPCILQLDGVSMSLGRSTVLFAVRDLAEMLIDHYETGAVMVFTIELLDGTKIEREVTSFTVRNLLPQLALYI